jgi:hypothetical protein
MVSETQGDNGEAHDNMESEIHLHSEFFKLAVKDELHISSVVTLKVAIGMIETCLTAKKIPHPCLEHDVNWISEALQQLLFALC